MIFILFYTFLVPQVKKMFENLLETKNTMFLFLFQTTSHEVVNINLKSKPDWFLTLNPLGTVPVLQIDDKVVVDSAATSDWLDDVYPKNRLQPADPYRRAWDRVLFEYIGKVGPLTFKFSTAS